MMKLSPLVLLAMLMSSVAHAVQISEIRIDQPQADPDEYFELSGMAAESLAGLTYLVIGDGTGGSGVIEEVTDLNNFQLGNNGFFVVAESTFTLGNRDLTETLSFENSDNVTHMLVSGFTGSNGDDLDTNDDGTFDTTPWTSIIDSVALVESTTSGEQVYGNVRVGPDGTNTPAHIYRCIEGFRIGPFDPNTSAAKDTPGAANDCAVTSRTIPEIQSTQGASPYIGDLVQTTGIVTADFQGTNELNGFFMQDANGDGNSQTSDGIFVYDPNGTNVMVGQEVQVIATVTEYFGLTELINPIAITVTGAGNITPTNVALPEANDGDLERYEGMLVQITSPMTVSQNFFLGRYGQMTLSSPDDNNNPGRLYQPTNLFAAGTQTNLDMVDSNARRILILDDGQDVSGLGDNPNPVPYIGAAPNPTVIRAGDTVSNLIGVLDYGRINSSSPPANDYRLHPVPTSAPVFTPQNVRESAPTPSNGSLKIASFNVLNYFTTIDNGGFICGPSGNLQRCRGADSSSELVRQAAKIVTALQAMDADVVGLIEVENNGFGTNSTIQSLVTSLNTAIGSQAYDVLMVNQGQPLGTDVITVGFIYKPTKVTPIGNVATLDTGAFSQTITDGGRSRIPVAASFREVSSGEVFTTAINHFKSKRPPSSVQGNGNDDQNDGQGSWNLRRTEAANDIADWLATYPTGINDPDILIMGDLNAYAEESPMLALESKGYRDIIQQFSGSDSYSFTFDGQAGSLDQALATSSIVKQVVDVTEWHINTDEPAVLSYDEDFNPAGYFSADPFRSSDHDPVIVGLKLSSDSCFVLKAENNNVMTFCL